MCAAVTGTEIVLFAFPAVLMLYYDTATLSESTKVYDTSDDLLIP